MIIYSHDGDALLLELTTMPGGDIPGTDNDAIHPSFTHGLDNDFQPFQIAVISSDEEAVSRSMGFVIQSLEDFAEEGIVNAADNDPQSVGAVGLQATGYCAWDVSELLGVLFDPDDGIWSDGRMFPQGARDC